MAATPTERIVKLERWVDVLGERLDALNPKVRGHQIPNLLQQVAVLES